MDHSESKGASTCSVCRPHVTQFETAQLRPQLLRRPRNASTSAQRRASPVNLLAPHAILHDRSGCHDVGGVTCGAARAMLCPPKRAAGGLVTQMHASTCLRRPVLDALHSCSRISTTTLVAVQGYLVLWPYRYLAPWPLQLQPTCWDGPSHRSQAAIRASWGSSAARHVSVI